MEDNSTIDNNYCQRAFFNYTNLSHAVNHEDFSGCLQETILHWIPPSVLILFGVIEFFYYFSNKNVNRNIPFNKLNVSKLIFIATLILIHLCQISIFYAVIDIDAIIDQQNKSSATTYIEQQFIFLASYLVSSLLLLVSLKYGIRTSPTQFVFYLISVICGASYFQTASESTSLILGLYCAHFLILFILLILNCLIDLEPQIWNEELKNLETPFPQLSASFASKLCYFWVTPLLWKGYKTPLEQSSLWSVDPSLTSNGSVPIFDQYYEKPNRKSKNVYVKVSTTVEPTKIEEGEEEAHVTDDKTAIKSSVAGPLVKAFGAEFLFGSFLHLIHTVMMMMPSQVMKLLISHVKDHGELGDNDLHYNWKGYFYGGILLGITVFQSLLSGQYYEILFRVGLKVRSVLISTIYRKSLRLANEAKKDTTTGEIVNLMSIDVQRFMDLLASPFGTINSVWSTPLQIFLICYFIYIEVDNAMFAGVAVIVISLPITGIMASFARKLQLQQMQEKDKRIKLLNEILSGIKVIKMYGWEDSFINQTLDYRNKETSALLKIAWWYAVIIFVSNSLPFLFGLSAFTVYIFMDEGQVLVPEKAFVVLSYLQLLRFPLIILPIFVGLVIQASASLKRINKFLNNPEIDFDAIDRNTSSDNAVIIQEGTFKWDSADKSPSLEDINISIKSGSLTAVVGMVGSGKSSLISACLGDLFKCYGSVNINGKVGYVPQQAWIQNATLKDNILFGENFNKEQYDTIIDSCSLKSDLEILGGGDMTEIGERGINLSGGQKQRVSLARAVYSDSDVYFLDDPLSAVDAHVGKHIFSHVLGPDGILKNKTRVLVTHGISFLPQVDHILVIKDGKISEQGSFQELLDIKGDFASFLLEHMNEKSTGDTLDEEIEAKLRQTLGSEGTREGFMENMLDQKEGAENNSSSNNLRNFQSQKSHLSGIESVKTEGKMDKQQKENKLIETETTETREVKKEVYWYYIRRLGWSGIFFLFLNIIYKGSAVGTDYWLSVWTNNTLGDSSIPENRNMYLGVYGVFGFVLAFSGMILHVTLTYSTLRASKKMHKDMLKKIMQSPMSFFDTTPLGRIVNRFARDVDVCDGALPTNIRYWLSVLVNFTFTILMIISIIPIIISVVIPTTILYFGIQRIYIRTSRQLKRLETVSRSPIYSHFTETLNGASVIRSFNKEKLFIAEAEKKVDENQVCFYYSFISSRWLAILIENIGNVITFMVAIFVLNSGGDVSPSEVGLLLVYALNITMTLNMLVVSTADIETNIVAVERIMEYGSLIQEANFDSEDGNRPPKGWPEKGQITFEKYDMRYRQGMDLVLKSITCDIGAEEKVGIVGRTGAGKSSLTLALFRLVEAAGGKILIDGRDTASIGLHDLRKQITIIPQDPVIFSGTIRKNLDPFNEYTDDQVWRSLQQSHLSSHVSSKDEGLEHIITEGGENLSVGQRQLLCLARALLKKTKILVLDEATAAVDLETDDLIQETISKEFNDCTIFTIAHRINTIMNYDKIMVLDNGKVVEFDTVSNLLKNTNGIFYSMAKESRLVEK